MLIAMRKQSLSLYTRWFRILAISTLLSLPLGASAREHGVTATLVRRLRDNLRLTLRYGYFHFLDGTFGGSRDYEAHALFSSLQWRF